MSDIKPFLCAEADTTALRSEWEKWFRSFKLYLQAEEITDTKKKKNKLLHLAGPQLQDVIFNIPGALVDNDEEDVFKILVEKLDEHFTPTRNSTFERHLFRTITTHEGEDINKFLLRLRQQASKCTFGETKEEIIENCLKDKIIDSWAPTEFRKKLLEKEMSLKEIVEMCQMHQHILKQSNKMDFSTHEIINKINNGQYKNLKTDECGRCGHNSHKTNDERCPARNAKCNMCGLIGHFAKKCRTKSRKRGFLDDKNRFQKRSRIRCVEDDESDTNESRAGGNKTDCLRINDNTEEDVVVWCVLGGQSIKMIIDSGCRFNLIGEQDWYKLKSNNARVWNLRTNAENWFKAYATNQPLEIVQVFDSTIAINGYDEIDTFYVIKNGNQSLLGRNTAIRLQVLKLGTTINNVDCVKPFPKIKDIKVKLTIDQGVKPVQQPLRRIPVAVEKRVEERLNEALALDIIERVKGPSQWISPIVPIFKENGELRLCVDMRQANKAVQRENYPLPTFETFMTKLRGAKIFSRLDLKWAYHQVELEESSRYITTFVTHKGLFRYKRLMFGISSAPEIFQRIVENLLSGCNNVLNYIDDIIIFGDTIESHDEMLSTVLETLKQNKVQLNEGKCVWRVKELKFLGHVLSDKGINPDPVKIQTIENFRAPTTKEELRSFLGLVTYVGKFMTDLATTTEPLRKLLKYDMKFIWNQKEQESFDVLKKQLANLPTSKPPARVERWLLRLQAFKFKVIYKAGKENIADPLSRLCVFNKASETGHHSEQDVFLVIRATIPIAVSIQEVLEASEQDVEISEAIKFLQNDNWTQNSQNCYFPFRYELSSVATILLRGTRLVIPKTLRSQTLELAHEGHPGESAMKRRIRAKVWWPLVDQEVVRHVKSCKECLLVAQPDNPPPMNRTIFPNGPWQCVASDLLGPLPRNDYIFVLIDYYSRYQEIKITKKITSEAIINILKEKFCRLGIPLSLRADNGRQYVSMEFKTFCKTNNIKLISTTPYWPQANGEVENMNRTIVKRLKIAQATHKNYIEEIQKFILMYNVTLHSTTGVTPSELMFGRPIRDKIPGINDVTESIWESAARDSDLINKNKGKATADKKRKAKESDVKVGDTVLLKNVIFPNKLTTPFDILEYVVTSRKGDEVVVARGEKTYRRHISHVKKCNPKQLDPTPDEPENEPNIHNAEPPMPVDPSDRPALILKLKNKEGMWQPTT